MSLFDSDSGLVLDDNQSATLINDFVYLTKNFPPVKNEWFHLQCPDNFPAISVEDMMFD